jgi:hypothetical protein
LTDPFVGTWKLNVAKTTTGVDGQGRKVQNVILFEKQ